MANIDNIQKLVKTFKMSQYHYACIKFLKLCCNVY